MKRNSCSLSLIQYEIKNVCGNPFTIFFSTVFPILMAILMNEAFMKQIPEAFRTVEVNKLFMTMSMVVPMSIFLIGHGANYSQELEKEIPVRMNLFGFSHTGMMIAKMCSNFLFMTVALVIYTAVSFVAIGIQFPTGKAAIIYIITLYALAAVFFVIAHAIATWTKRFGPTYAITMMMYFLFMIFCGMMGIPIDFFPKGVRRISEMLPMTYVSRDFGEFWQGGNYNFAPFLQAMLFLAAVAGILWFFSVRRERRVIR